MPPRCVESLRLSARGAQNNMISLSLRDGKAKPFRTARGRVARTTGSSQRLKMLLDRDRGCGTIIG